MINCWQSITWLLPILQVHKQFREGAAFPAPPVSWADGKQLRKVVSEAGFKEEKLRLESQEVQSVVPEGDFRDGRRRRGRTLRALAAGTRWTRRSGTRRSIDWRRCSSSSPGRRTRAEMSA